MLLGTNLQVVLLNTENFIEMNMYYLILLLTWLMVCSIYALLEMYSKKRTYSSDITAFTAFWFVAILVLYVLTANNNVFIQENKLYVIIGVSAIVMLVCVAMIIKQRKQTRILLRNLGVAIVSAGVMYGVTLFELDATGLQYIVYGISAVYFLGTIITVIVSTAIKKHLNGFGCFYVIFSELAFIGFIYLSGKFDSMILSFAIFVATFTIHAVFHTLYNMIFTHALIEANTDFEKKRKALNEAEEHISELVCYNPDTRLPNIAKLEPDLDQQIYKGNFLLMLNLDNYKTLSNTMGFRKTASIMVQIANNILWTIGELGHLYHIANDKFIIIYSGNNEECGTVIRKLLDVFILQDIFTINLKPYIGYTVIQGRVFEFESILRELELASEAAREANNFYAQYTYDLYKKAQRRVVMETHLKNAVETKSWELYLQPKVSVQTNKIIGAEGLIRWKGQEGKISPAMFIPLAEELGLIVDIGKTIIEKGFAYAKAIVENVMPDFIMAINLSAFQLMRKDFVQYIDIVREKYNVNPHNITFEITESAFIDNMDRVKEAVVFLRSRGYHFSLDDFGTGYSSISYLSSFELDEVKFDREFMISIEHDKKNVIILQTVTNLAKNLGLKVVTEGVESASQLETIRQIGCEVYQGYYFSKAVSLNDFVALLKKNLSGEYFGMEEQKGTLPEN